MKKFNVGDKLKVVQEIGELVVGDIVTAQNATDGGLYDSTDVIRDRDSETFRGCYAKRFELVRIDFTKPVFTKEGTPVEIVTTQGRDTGYPVLAYEGKATQTSKFTADGKSRTGDSRRNLTNEVPKKKEPITVTRYVNLFDDGTSSLFVQDSRKDADRTAENQSHRKRIGVAKVVVTEGQFDA